MKISESSLRKLIRKKLMREGPYKMDVDPDVDPVVDDTNFRDMNAPGAVSEVDFSELKVQLENFTEQLGDRDWETSIL